MPSQLGAAMKESFFLGSVLLFAAATAAPLGSRPPHHDRHERRIEDGPGAGPWEKREPAELEVRVTVHNFTLPTESSRLSLWGVGERSSTAAGVELNTTEFHDFLLDHRIPVNSLYAGGSNSSRLGCAVE